jgi:hypothetical protein
MPKKSSLLLASVNISKELSLVIRTRKTVLLIANLATAPSGADNTSN